MTNLFRDCKKLTSLNLSNFNTSKVEDMFQMFCGCIILSSLDLSNFDTSNVKDMFQMFSGSNNLKSLNLSNFKTDKVTGMAQMFYNCQSLEFLDISNFNTAQITDMTEMFKSCKNLKSLSVASFDVSLVTNMNGMFYDCHSLTSLDLSGFENSQVATMKEMFYNCTLLSEINLSNFTSSSLNNIENMFENCKNLEYINFRNYNELNPIVVTNALGNVPNNIVICINLNNTITNLKGLINSLRCHTIYCCDDWRDYIKQLMTENDTCIGKFFQNPGGLDYCQPEIENIITSNIITTNNLEENNEITSNITNINTEEEINSIKIYETSDEINENTVIKTNENGNAFTSSSQLIESICDISKNSNSKNSYNIQSYFIQGENNEEIYQKIFQCKKNIFDSKFENLVIIGKDNFVFQIITFYNRSNIFDGNNNITNQLSKIDLGECENILKDHYHINRNQTLIIIIFENIANITRERSIQYEVYEPLNKTKLNLSVCEEITIMIYIPVALNEDLLNLFKSTKEQGYDLININSSFYQDICTPFTSPNGTDVILTDR